MKYFYTSRHRHRLKSAFFIAFISIIFSCNGPKGPAPTYDMAPITVENPLFGKPVGYLGAQDFTNYSDVRLKVKVSTVDANNNAILYSNLDQTFAQDFNRNSTFFQESIKVPTSGSIVVQVELMGLECILSQSTCSPIRPAKREYFYQSTHHNGIPASFAYSLADLKLLAQLCCP